MDELGMGDVFSQIAQTTRGLISDWSNRLKARRLDGQHQPYQHILTIEDPIEFVQLTSGRSAWVLTRRSALRCVRTRTSSRGEMRDLETIRLALEAAETGHVVFGTLHTPQNH